MKHKKLLVFIVVVVLAVAVVAALPLFVNAEQLKPRVEAALSDSLGREVHIGRLSLSPFKGALTAEELTLAEDSAFGREPFVKAKMVAIGVEMMPLIMKQQVNVRSLVVDSPEVRLVRAADGRWNFSSIGSKSKRPAGPQADVSVAKLTVREGRILIRRAAARQTSTYEHVRIEAKDLSSTSRFPFEIAASTPGSGSLKLAGEAGPIGRTDAAQTPFDADVKLDNLDVARTGFLQPDSGLAGVFSFHGNVKSDGRTVEAAGKGTGDKLRLVRTGTPVQKPIAFDVAAKLDLMRQVGTLRKGLVKIGATAANLSGAFDTSAAATAVRMELTAHDVPVQDIQAMLPAIGVILPTGASLNGGTANADLSLLGPLDRLVTTGIVDLKNARLTNFDLGSKLSTIGKLTGLKTNSNTDIQLLSTNLRVAPEGIQADNLNLVVPALGTLKGKGTIAANNALDFKMTAELNPGQGVLGVLTTAAGLGQRKATVPFSIRGTTSNPVFVPDVMGTSMQNTTTTPAKSLGDVIGGFFGKR